MKLYKHFTLIVTFTLIFFTAYNSYAGVEPELKNYLTGPSIFASNSTTVYDQVLLLSNGTPNVANNPLDWHLRQTTNVVTLEINQENIIDCVLPQFKFDITVNVEAHDEYGAMLPGFPKNISLSVDYNTVSGQTYNERHSDTFSKAFYTKITIVSISDPLLVDFVKIGTRTIIERYKDIDLNIIPSFQNYIIDVSNTEIEFYWDPIDGAEEYDFEWTYVDDYDMSGGLAIKADLFTNFDKDATRVSVKENHYSVSQVYERGYIVVRVRATGLSGVDFDHRVNGQWSESGSLTSLTNFLDGYSLAQIEENPNPLSPPPLIEHEPQLTWQYSSVYAEEGKKKEVIQYFDGSLRNRQSVTKVNTDEMAIVGENVYDHIGRPAVSILPVPAMENKLKYYTNFNVSSSSTENYHYNDFDIDNGSCFNNVNSMSDLSGAANYYSENNSLATSMHYEYLPNSFGYPFALTEFEPDGTGRIRRQGGVGNTHQLNSGHETKYYYATPDQQELDRLFGSAVGYNEHYQKEMVVDPNGQVSVSYKNLSGKVIATALAGSNATNTNALPNMTAPEPLTFNLLSTTDTSLGTNFIQVNKKFTVAKLGDHTFSYNIDIPRYLDALKPTLCFDCVYDLEITLLDECGEEVFPSITRTLGKPLGNAFDTDCESGPGQYSFTGDAALSNQDIIISLDIGSYTIIKTLRINEEAISFYEKEFLQGPEFRSEEDFINDFMAQIDTAACYMTCDECNDRIGTLPEFLTEERAKITVGGGTPTSEDDEDITALYNTLKANCDEICETSYISCDAMYEVLKIDISPGGQYATVEYDELTETRSYGGLLDALTYGADEYYYTGKFVSGIYTVLEYKDEDGNLDEIEVDGVLRSPENLTPENFVKYWKPSWANELVKFHPEYCRYEACIANQTSEEFNEEMLETETYAEALSKGFLNPLNTNPSFTYISMDPYFASGGQGNSSLTSFSNLINAYQNPNPVSGYGCIDISIWEIPLSYFVCNENDCSAMNTCLSGGWSQTSCQPYLDRMWKMFRAIYIAEKGKLEESLNESCSRDLQGKIRRFYKFDDAIAMLGGDLNSETAIKIEVLGQIEDHCETVCESQADVWMKKLIGCDYLTDSDSVLLREALIDVCKRGCDGNNAMGASTVAPGNELPLPNYNSFKEAFDYLKDNGKLTFIAGICDINLIDGPRKYDHDYSAGNKFSLNKCDSFLIKNVPGCLQDETNEEIKMSLIYEIIALQDSIECKNCIDCHQLFFGVTALLEEYGIGFMDDEYNMQKVSETFLNNYFNFNLTYDEYADFAKRCMGEEGTSENSTWLKYYYDNYWSVQFALNSPQPFSPTIPKGMGPHFKEIPILLASNLASIPPPSPGMIPLDDCGCNELQNYFMIWQGLPNPKSPFNSYVETQIAPCELPPGSIDYEILLNHCLNAYTSMVDGNDGSLMYVMGPWNLKQKLALYHTVEEFNLELPDCFPCDGNEASGWIDRNIKDDCPIDCNTLKDFIATYPGCPGVGQMMSDLSNTKTWITSPSLDTNCLRQFMIDLYLMYPEMLPCAGDNGRAVAYTSAELGNRTLQSFIDKYAHCFLEQTACDGSIYPTDDPECCYQRNGNDAVMEDFLNQMTLKLGSSQTNLFGYVNYQMHPVVDKFYNTNMYANGTCPPSIQNDAVWFGYIDPSNPSNTYKLHTYRGKFTDGCGFDAEIYMVGSATDYNFYPWIIQFDSVRGMANGCKPGNNFRALATHLNPSTSMIEQTWVCGYYDSLTYHDTCKGPKLKLCDREAFTPITPIDTNDCVKQLKLLAEYQGKRAYKEYQDSLKYDFREKYLAKCKEAWNNETFTRSFLHQEYHYTLYYYDQVGNLEQTVPPLGVQMLSSIQVQNVDLNRKTGSGTTIYPNHTHNTEYVYNTLNQLKWQKTPDAGESNFWYDNLGRLVVSQNAEQYLNSEFSYTNFDALGRITEVGQMKEGICDLEKPTLKEQNGITINLDGLIVKTESDGWNNSGASSFSQITGDGYAETTISSNPWDNYANAVGISYQNIDDHFNTIDYGWYINTLNYNVIINGVNTASYGSPTSGDELRVERIGNTIYFKINGFIMHQIAESQPNDKMIVDIAMYYNGKEIRNLSMGGEIGMDNEIAFDPTSLNNYIGSSLKSQVTKTYYDVAPFSISYLDFSQENLRKRVVSTTYQETDSDPVKHAVHYTYDLIGNVTDIVREMSELIYLGHEYKLTHYDFDLVSGNVNQVTYQPNQSDQFIHKYNYDGDNRISTVMTSTDNIHYDQEASYDYYLHGPLKRTEIGNLSVQGVDYVYTLQGWLKGVNGTTQESDRDVGKDGVSGLHINTAVDAFGFSLGYYSGDHEAIGRLGGSPSLNQVNYFIPESAGSDLEASAPDLWNGNIKEMVTAIKNLSYGATGMPFAPMARSFKYDQLNRIASTVSFNNYDLALNQWNSGTQIGGKQDFEENFTYDANGNILTLNRFAVNTGGLVQQMDAFTYNYKAGTNQLEYVQDAIGAGVYSNDIDDQLPNNYNYDAIGNLIQDIAEEIDNIEWTVYGKIKSIIRNPVSTKPSLEFEYTPDGHRTVKKVYSPITNKTKIFLYCRDASGNEMANYSIETDGNILNQIINSTIQDTILWDGSPIYGSSRLGVYRAEKQLSSTLYSLAPDSILFKRTKRSYELSNHLGNVLAVISDKRTSICTGSMTVAYYEPDILSATDYYTFGSAMETRSYSSSDYKYGFNGQEKDDEIAGSGNSYTAEFWQYDSRLGRRFNVDPIFKEYESPYSCFGNNPFGIIDPNGADSIKLQDGTWGWKVENGDNASKIKAKTGVLMWDLAKLNKGKQEGGGHFNDIGDGNWKRYWEAGKGTEYSMREGDILRLSPEVSGGDNVNNQNIEDKSNSNQEEISNNNNELKSVVFTCSNLASGIAAEFGKNTDKTYRLFNKSGKNFSPKIYDNGWGGGSTGKIKTYKLPGALKATGKLTGPALGLYSAKSINEQYMNNEISTGTMLTEQASNAFSTFGGIYGASWGFGWDMGKKYGPSKWYGDDDYSWFK